ncbi:hypothetical protein [Alteromonas sp. a30]|uniref:hypothetical protein n=1 Tax=Alteromonas sp. a30 TaxID=2730917 RepID=UPI00227E14A2|nr:hypothetical protein [Alteromonas sp. a30]MCY7294258.1 hypothetical protein [Alteromonas sp. a30]
MRLIITFFMIAIGFSAFGEQEQFSREETEKDIQFHYVWRDANDAQKSLEFSIDKQLLHDQFQTIKSYKQDIAQRYIYIALQKAAMKVSPKEARIKIKKLTNNINISVKANSSEKQRFWLNNMHTAKEAAFDAYLQENYYNRYQSPTGQQGVKPDHIRFVKDNRVFLLPIAQAIYDRLEKDSSTRAYVNLLLGWLQSIPYDPLEDRLTSNGSGFLPPAQVITGNLGDCDSKTVLAASLMRSLLPNLSMVIIYLPNHALLGAALPHREDEKFINLDGLDYLLMEPTGPALFVAGEVAPSSEHMIDSGMFTYEKVP